MLCTFTWANAVRTHARNPAGSSAKQRKLAHLLLQLRPAPPTKSKPSLLTFQSPVTPLDYTTSQHFPVAGDDPPPPNAVHSFRLKMLACRARAAPAIRQCLRNIQRPAFVPVSMGRHQEGSREEHILMRALSSSKRGHIPKTKTRLPSSRAKRAAM